MFVRFVKLQSKSDEKKWKNRSEWWPHLLEIKSIATKVLTFICIMRKVKNSIKPKLSILAYVLFLFFFFFSFESFTNQMSNVWNAALFSWSLSVSLSIKKIEKKVFIYGLCFMHYSLDWINFHIFELSFFLSNFHLNTERNSIAIKKKNTYASSIRRLRLSIFVIHLQAMSTYLNSVCIQKS